MKGHVGKILKLDLTGRKAEIIPTKKYEKWIGGIGMGTAVFWDEVDKDYITDTSKISGFEPENVICIMTGVLSGAIVPGGARTEVCGIAPEVCPRPQFLGSNFGGYFGPMLKFAGYDGIVIEGKADAPVWVDIRDEDVQIKDAGHLWGLGFFETEKEIWREIAGEKQYGGWLEGTTQRAEIVGIGQCGENLGRIGCLVHGANGAAGCGGFGGVFGSKNLKAISVIGTGSVEVARPKELMEVWKWAASYKPRKSSTSLPIIPSANFPTPLGDKRRVSCFGCTAACKVNSTEKVMRGSTGQCVGKYFYASQDKALHGEKSSAEHVASQLTQDYGINVYAAWNILIWLESLHERGLLGKGKRLDTDLDFDKLGTEEFAREYLKKIACREGIGDDLAEGWVRAAAKWGVLEEDLKTGLISAIHWGIGDQHWTNNIEWAYLSLFDVRNCCAHDMMYGRTLEETADRYAELAPPWHDALMLDQSKNGVYSIHCARLVAWHSRYVNMKGSVPWCDWFPFDIFNSLTEDGKGLTPAMEERYYAAVTGENLSWEEALEIGRKIWNFKRALLVLNGRHRDEEYFPPYPPYTSYVYTEGPPTLQWGSFVYMMDLERGGRGSLVFRPLDEYMMRYGVYKDGKWEWSTEPFPLDKDKMDEFKTIYYGLEGWDTETGWPTKSTLEGCGLGYVADVLEKQGKQLKP